MSAPKHDAYIFRSIHVIIKLKKCFMLNEDKDFINSEGQTFGNYLMTDNALGMLKLRVTFQKTLNYCDNHNFVHCLKK